MLVRWLVLTDRGLIGCIFKNSIEVHDMALRTDYCIYNMCLLGEPKWKRID